MQKGTILYWRTVGSNNGPDAPRSCRDAVRLPVQAAGIRFSTIPAYQLEPAGIASSLKL